MKPHDTIGVYKHPRLKIRFPIVLKLTVCTLPWQLAICEVGIEATATQCLTVPDESAT